MAIDRPEPDLAEQEQRVTPLELFFDLVFVFAITQVTAYMAHRPTWGGLVNGLLILGAVWWAWAAYAWLTNTLDPEEGGTRLAMFGSMAAMLIVALAVPRAFGADALAFGCAYLVVRALHLLLYARGAPDVGVRAAVIGLLPSSFAGASLIILASAFDGTLQGALWVAALAIDYGGPVVRGMEGWRVWPGHFAERHGLIVIIALGESVVSVGAGTVGIHLDAQIMLAAVLGTVIAAALWWAYFDVVAPVAERRLRAATGLAQVAMARDSYSYIHMPMVAGIVLVALGMKKTLAHVDAPLGTIPAVALCGGVALYLAALVAFRLRNLGTLNRQRAVAAVAAAALVPAALHLDALAALGVVAGLLGSLIAYEAVHFREARARIRAGLR